MSFKDEIFKQVLKAANAATVRKKKEYRRRQAILFEPTPLYSISEAGNSYGKLLQTNEWKSKRNKILERDNFRCQKCGNTKLLKDTFAKFCVVKQQTNKANPESWEMRFRDYTQRSYSAYYRGSMLKIPQDAIFFLKKMPEFRNKVDLMAIGINRSNKTSERMRAAQTSYRDQAIMSLDIIDISSYDKIDFLYVKNLHVHHEYYTSDFPAPWEYKDVALTCLCKHCHEEWHKQNDIKIYEDSSLTSFSLGAYCSKCNGTGYLPQYSYHVNGICFSCDGKGVR